MTSDLKDWLGLKRRDDGDGVVLDTRPEHQIAPETSHFAVLTTLAEVSAAHSVGVAVVPASVHVQLLRRARPGRLHGRGRALAPRPAAGGGRGRGHPGRSPVAEATVRLAVLG